jgi:peptidoglycan/LPS O-acetylase OafA/YrhL
MATINRVLSTASTHGPSELEHIDYLDGWRGMAILLVLLAHFYRDVQYGDYAFGRMGVDVFFVLSGLLMSKILFVKRTTLGTFYKRRISRVFPAFFFYVIAVYGLHLVTDSSNPELPNIFYTLLFIRTYLPSEPGLWGTTMPIGHIWSLNVEEHSYVLLSLLTLLPLARGREHFILIGLGIFSIVLQWLYREFPAMAPTNWALKSSVNISFIMLSAGYFLALRQYRLRVPGWLPLLTLTLSLLCYTPITPGSFRWLASPFLLAFTINHLSEASHGLKASLSIAPLRLLGVWSFSIYLWQQPMFIYFVRGGEAFPFAGTICLLASIALGTVSFYFVENPLRRLINNAW